MALSFDAFTASSPGTSISDFSHAGGTPRWVCVCVGLTNTTDEVTSVTYGGLSLTEMTGSPHAGTTEGGGLHVFAAYSSIPTGTQTVSVTTSGTTATKVAYCITCNGTGDSELIDSDVTIIGDTVTDPSVTLSLGGRTSFCCVFGYTGENAVTGTTPLSGWTSQAETSSGSEGLLCYTYDTVGSSDVTAGWTQPSNDALMFAIAVSEVVGGGTPTRRSSSLTLMGVQ